MEVSVDTPSSQLGIAEQLAVLRRFLHLLIIPAAVVLALFALIAFALPSMYRSTAVLLVEQQEIPQDLVRSTITTYVTQRFESLQRRVMTRATLLDLVEKYDLYPEDAREVPAEVLLERFGEDMSITPLSIEVVDPRSGRPTQATSAFELAFDSRSPTKAYSVLTELVNLLLEQNARNRTELARGTSAFLSEEAARLERELAVLGSRFADFKEANVNNLPELLELNYRLLEREEAALEDTRRQMSALDEQLIYLRAELDQLNPYGMLVGTDGRPILGPQDRLRSLEAELASVESRYSSDHPDIIRLRSEIAALEAGRGGSAGTGALRQALETERQALERARQRYSEDHPEVTILRDTVAQLEASIATRPAGGAASVNEPTNPAYVSLLARIQSAEVQRQSLQAAAAELRARTREYEDRIRQTPQIEKDYVALSQDYENARAKYQEVRARQLEAELSESLEQERKGERLALIEPPLVPELPVSPNRPLLLAVGVVLAGAVGVVAVFIAQALDGSVFGARSVAQLVGAAPIGLIPVLYTPEELEQRRLRLKYALIGGAVAAVVLLLLVHFFVMPLDTIFYRLLDGMGF